MKKRMRQLTTVNSTLIFKYTCTVCTCMCHEEIQAQKCINIIVYIILSHMYAVYSTQHWILLPVVVYTRTCSNKYGVLLRGKIASSLVSPPHEHILILDLCTSRKIRQRRVWYVKSHA